MQAISNRLGKKYNSKSWLNPRVEIRASSIDGKGMFAREPIQKGEVIVVWGGKVFSEADIQAGKARERSLVDIDEGVYLGNTTDEPEELDEFMNHNCDSNVWLEDEITLVARRHIAKDEEITLDYALWETDSSWEMECYCGSPFCRKLITGNDWKLKEVQIRYQKHFSPYVIKRINNFRNKEKTYLMMHN